MDWRSPLGNAELHIFPCSHPSVSLTGLHFGLSAPRVRSLILQISSLRGRSVQRWGMSIKKKKKPVCHLRCRTPAATAAKTIVLEPRWVFAEDLLEKKAAGPPFSPHLHLILWHSRYMLHPLCSNNSVKSQFLLLKWHARPFYHESFVLGDHNASHQRRALALHHRWAVFWPHRVHLERQGRPVAGDMRPPRPATAAFLPSSLFKRALILQF